MCRLRPNILLLGSILLICIYLVHAAALASDDPQATGAALSNADVVKMVQAKLPDTVIVAKIKSSACKFDTSTDALIKLQQTGVSGAVLSAMAECGATPAPAAVAAAPDPNDPASPHDPGIYYLNQAAREKRMMALEPSVYSGGKTGGLFKSAMTYGVAKAQWKAVVKGNAAAVRLSETRPVFYFYFEEKAGTLSYSGAWGGSASSPNEFTLARMEKKSNERELVVGQRNAFGASTGTRSQDSVAFDFEKVKPGVYKVQPREDMTPGEYCFFYAGSSQAMGATGGKLFDFGLDRAQ